jgi:acetylglutamate kinase
VSGQGTETGQATLPVSGARTFVVKMGGEVVRSQGLADLAHDLIELRQAGVRLVVVHGGGPQATELSKRLGMVSTIVGGRRVTDAATLDVMKMTVAGQVNSDLCAALVAAGGRPIGLHGASGPVIVASRRPPKIVPGEGPEPVDFGLVGDVVSVDGALLTLLSDHGYLPVVACLGCGTDGAMYNINADTVANQVAIALRADGLLLVTDVPGVLRDITDPTSRIATLTAAEGSRAIADGTVKKGMIPKLEESFAAIAEGVSSVYILGKLGRGDLVRAVQQPGNVGTVLLP